MNQILNIGDRALDFDLNDQDNNRVTLKNFADYWLILYFYPKDNTPGCTTEAKDFTAYTEEFAKLGAKIVGISPDSSKTHSKFREKHELSITLLSDPGHKLAEIYGVWQLKKFMGKEYMGIVRTTFLINPVGEIAYIWTKVKVKNHAEIVLNKLRECSKVT